MIINREWAMPSKDTFSIKPINALIERHFNGLFIDPFARNSSFNSRCLFTNDLNIESATTHHFELEEILIVAHGGAHNDTIVTVERKT